MERYIRRVRVEGMFGRKPELVVDFTPADNCIYGVNGSGKTVLINLIVAALQVDVNTLFALPFSTIKILTSPTGGKKESNFFTVNKFGDSISYIFHEDIDVPSRSLVDSTESTSLSKIEKDKSYKFSIRHARGDAPRRSHDFKKTISRYVSLTYIPLLRMHDSSGKADDVLLYEMRRQRLSDREISEFLDPSMRVLKKLQDEFSGRYTRAQSQIASELESLKSTIFERLLFEELDNKDEANKYVTKILSSREVGDERSAEDVITQIKDLNLEVPEERIRKHFSIWNDMKLTLLKTLDAFNSAEKKDGKKGFAEKEYKAYSQAYFNLISSVRQFQKFDQVIKLIYDMQSRKSELLSKFSSFKKEVNDFLSEGKEVSFSDVGIFIITSGGEPVSLQDLSSGEKHILAILGRVCLSSFTGTTVFIADEPELSLHLEWQRQILPSIRRLSPDTQVIVATHAPAIISEKAQKINLRKCYKNG
jgi:predicted ATPase